MRKTMTSRERMLGALNKQEVDHIPCCFMSFAALRKRYNEDRYKIALAELEMGLDSMLFIPTAPRPTRPDHPDLRGLPVRISSAVRTVERRETLADGQVMLHKEYQTPAGSLTSAVALSEDWPHGNHIPFLDDYQVPRSTKFLVTQPDDLAALDYLLVPPNADDIATFRQEAREAAAFCKEHQILLTGGWGVGWDMCNWLMGMEPPMASAMENPGFMEALLHKIHRWNLSRMQVVLESKVDLYIRRAWYEGCDFITPDFYRKYMVPILKAEVDLAHQYGARFGYICTSGTVPLLGCYAEAGIDTLIAIDPIQGTHTDMPLMRKKLGGKVCLWGGVSGAITVEMGTADAVRAAVRQAIATLGPDGFVLSPVDNLTIDAPRTWDNVRVFIDEWQKNR